VAKWITREHPKVDRVACPWLIERFIDREPEFFYVPADAVMREAGRIGATPYDVPNVELGHHGEECSFDAFVRKYELAKDAATAARVSVVEANPEDLSSRSVVALTFATPSATDDEAATDEKPETRAAPASSPPKSSR